MLLERIGRIIEELKIYSRSCRVDIDSLSFREGNFSYQDRKEYDAASWKPLEKDGRWGGRDKHFWFTATYKVPEKHNGKAIAFAVSTGRENDWDAVNPQFLVYVNGELIQGLDVNHREIILSQRVVTDDVYSIDLQAYSGMRDGLAELNYSVCAIEREVEKLYYDIDVPYNVAKLLDKEDKRRIDILRSLNDAVNLIDFRKPLSDQFVQSVIEADEYLEKEFYGSFCGDESITAHCVGHTHIDVAWLWTLTQTREKTARSFSTVLNLMKEYPEYIFMSSQPQLYKFIKTDHPEIYEEIKKRISEGRWEPEGAMWLEADCNISSGESLVRQVLFGTGFFEKEFNVKNQILWLPDVFGYSAALPQILKKSGIDYFMTTKISWNEYNKLPYDTFMWKGLDGTEILTHFITTQNYDAKGHSTTYNGALTPNEVMGSWRRYQQKDLSEEVLIAFGYGDGGGGPTKEMLENARRMGKGIPGCPKVQIGNSLDFFKRLDAGTTGNSKLPKWVGELYLEYHRGTYTSMARNKKFNRKSELMYQAAEFLSVADNLLVGTSPYPREKLNRGWETILLNQFHDILPGSSIKEVYEDSREQYIEVLKDGQEMLDASIDRIAGNIELAQPSIVVFNQLSFDRNDMVKLKLPDGYENVEIIDSEGTVLPSQIDGDGNAIFYAADVPSKGYNTYGVRRIEACACMEKGLNKAFDGILENGFFKIIFDDEMNIISLLDKKNSRETIKTGQRANVLQAFEDKPHNYDAWDINIYYQEKMWEVTDVESVEMIESGDVKTTVRITKRFCDSMITQDISIYSAIPRIDFKTMIYWKETQVLLKAAFPVDIHSDKATYEIQYGNVERPTYWNTSWDKARFEVCAHKWADLSEDGYGVSLLNDCKYGYDIKESVMRLTLLKSAKEPNPDADREIHEFTYSIYPHAGDFKAAGTTQMAYVLNNPLFARYEDRHSGKLADSFSLVKENKENVIIEVVKKAEDSDDMIVRLYEYFNRRSKVKLTFGAAISDVRECDLMEKDLCSIGNEEREFEFDIKPFEIKTFKLKLN